MKEFEEAQYYIKYKQLLEEVSELFNKLNVLSQEQGIDIFNTKYGLEEHYINIQKMKNPKYIKEVKSKKYINEGVNKIPITEPLQFKSIEDRSYAEKIKSNIVKAVENHIPWTDTEIDLDIAGRARLREQLIREWAEEIVKITGHTRHTAQQVL